MERGKKIDSSLFPNRDRVPKENFYSYQSLLLLSVEDADCTWCDYAELADFGQSTSCIPLEKLYTRKNRNRSHATSFLAPSSIGLTVPQFNLKVEL